MADLRESVKWMLFLSSYIPLYAILAYKHRTVQVTLPLEQYSNGLLADQTWPILTIIWIGLSLVSFVFLMVVLSFRKSREGKFKDVNSYKSRNDLVTNYILVYIFPFVVLDLSKVVNWMAFIVFFVVIGIIQTRSNQLHVNPILALLGYDIYEVDVGERERILLAKTHPRERDSPLKTVELSNDVLIAV